MNQSLFEAIISEHKRHINYVNEHAWKYETNYVSFKTQMNSLKTAILSTITPSKSHACCAPCC